MKKFFFLGAGIATGLIAILILIPHYEFHYYLSPDKLRTVTRVEYRQGTNYRVIFTPGRFDGRYIPDVRIEPINFYGLTNGFFIILEWNQDGSAIYAIDARHFNNHNLNDHFRFVDLDARDEAERENWYKMKNSDSSKYVRIYSKGL